MNELIETLASNARRMTEDETAYMARLHNREISLDESMAVYNTKFAELVVAECIERIEVFDHHINPVKNILPTMVAEVKEHFGIKV